MGIISARLSCIDCKKEYPICELRYSCDCGDLLEVGYDFSDIDVSGWKQNRRIGVWKYRELLPVSFDVNPVTLHEGGTPMYRAETMGKQLGLKNLYIKNEGANPTGSFKDRGMTVGVTKAVECGADTVACASTGNTSASLAAYAAKAGIGTIILMPHGKVALGKLSQALIYGARIISVKSDFDKALQIIRKLAETGTLFLLNSINPFRIEGQKTVGFEMAEQLSWACPDRIILPVGNAGNIAAVYKAFLEMKRIGLTDELPKITGVQAENAAPLYHAFANKLRNIEPVDMPETVATAIRIGNPVSWKKALSAARDSNGSIESVTDEEILEAQHYLAKAEGLFVEPASAAPVACLKKLAQEGRLDKDEKIACIATGHGLKDSDLVIERYSRKITEVEPDFKTIKAAIGR